MRTLRDVDENELVTVDPKDVLELLEVDPDCPHGFASIDYCPQCLFLVAGLALERLRIVKEERHS
jgi:hypothetical protein